MEIKKDRLLSIANNVNNLIRQLNLREGLNRKDDTLPKRFFDEGLRTGNSKGETVQKQEFEKMLNKYYKLRGWNKEGKLKSTRFTFNISW
ncbi:hypothetical protein DRO69_09670 [Candidatus Bathyarchaeota archaeon]|nr:MAG: hypothetical protein DRO69_09670 [Candidatus Bathyarchaeota archaeon]